MVRWEDGGGRVRWEGKVGGMVRWENGEGGW